MAEKTLKVRGFDIAIDKKGFVSLTDIAKSSSENKPNVTIQSWLRNQSTITYLETWEEVHNPNFKGSQMTTFRKFASTNRSKISATVYIEQTGAIGIFTKSGRYGGTYAHSDIALEFCSWLSPQFKVYLYKEFQRLKTEEQLKLGDPHNIKRYLTSGNYSLLVSAVLAQVDERLLTHPQPYKSRLPFAAEADMINEIVFGQTAQEWRRKNADKPLNRNQRDYAKVVDLQILANLESLDSMLLQWDCNMTERRKFLQEMYDFQYPILKRSKTMKKLQELADSIERNS